MVCFVLVGCVLLLKFALLVGDFVCIGGWVSLWLFVVRICAFVGFLLRCFGVFS